MHEKRNLAERLKHDASYKSFFAKRRTVADTLRGLALGLNGVLDFATLERMPASFVTENLGQRHADMLWKIQTVNKEWLYLLVLIEFQSTIDRRMALRMMNYAGGIWMGLGEDDLGPRGDYPSVLPVVVYNGERRWNAATDIRDLLTPVPEQLLGTQPQHPYLLMELQRLDPSTLPSSSVLSMIARLEQARSPEQLERLVATLVDWVERADAEELLDSFREWISQVLVQRHGPAGRALELKIRNKEEARMTTLIERARQWGEELNQHWLEKGIEEGIEKGIEKGIEEGLERGRAEGERALVYRLVARRFGPGAAEQLVPVLDAITDPELIAGVADAVVECRTAAEFIGRVKEVVGS